MSSGASKALSISLLVVAEIGAMSLWFSSAAVLPDMAREGGIGSGRQALLSSAVQAGFVFGALSIAATGIADRFDPRRVFTLSALVAAVGNACLLLVPVGGDLAISIRFVTGALLAGVYPVGMKIAVGWGTRDRGLLVGLLVGALTLGSASPHLAAYLGGADWRSAIATTSLLAAAGGLAVMFVGLGPQHARTASFDPRAIAVAWTDRRIRLTYFGYFGHMWELYAMWAWIGGASGASYATTMEAVDAEQLGKLTAFLAIGLGGFACAGAGAVADRIGKAEVTMMAMAVSGSCAVATALSFGGPIWVTLVFALIWGLSVVPDSAQFSALVADLSPPELAGSLLTLQTALGFTLTIMTVQATPLLVETLGWPLVLGSLALGPAFGIMSMARVRTLTRL